MLIVMVRMKVGTVIMMVMKMMRAMLIIMVKMILIMLMMMTKNMIIMLIAEIDISVSKLLGFETFANFLGVSVSISEIWTWKRKNPSNKNSARNEVPNLGLGPNWYQSPEMVPNKSQFCSQVPNFILVARCQAKSHILDK